MTGRRKTRLYIGTTAIELAVSSVALFVGLCTFAEWSEFQYWVLPTLYGLFVAGNAAEHVVSRPKKTKGE